MFCGYRLPAPDAPVHSPGRSPCPVRSPISRVFACLTVLAACAHAGAAEPDWRGYTSEQQQRSVLAVEQDAEAINKRYYDSAFEEFLPELEQLELSLAQPVVAVDEKGLLGDWKCRSTQADQYGIYRYPNFQCRIRRTDHGLFLEKTSGSQRVSGYLFREGARCYVFLGGATVNDEPQVAFVAWPTARRLSPTWSRCCARTPVASSCCSRNGAAATRSSSSAAEAQALSSS
ncbi:DUF4893 domain-containing protein [Pseudomonas aeruginosa]|nr:DUF4893 domain-containing protein [Pseudomonas aeruginosa]